MRTITLAVAANNPTNFQFEAGQYLGVMHPDGTLIPLSIASSPATLPSVELMYRSDLASETALAFDDLLAGSTHLQIDGPFGDVSLAKVNAAHGLRIVASGTGIAQGLSLVGELQHTQQALPTEVLWATQIETPSSRALLQNKPWLKVTRCASAELAAQLLASVELGKGQTGDVKTVIAGPPDFVYQVTDLLLESGVSQGTLAADAFAYAPR